MMLTRKQIRKKTYLLDSRPSAGAAPPLLWVRTRQVLCNLWEGKSLADGCDRPAIWARAEWPRSRDKTGHHRKAHPDPCFHLAPFDPAHLVRTPSRTRP